MMTGLPYGYTLEDLDKMTTAAVIADRSMAMGTAERRDIAWSAIAEALYVAERAPHRQELIRVGWQAIYSEIRDAYRHYGYLDRKAASGLGSAPGFAMYWQQRVVTRGHENRIVERYALGPILAALTDTQRAVVHAVAAFDGDKVAAAEHLHMKEAAFAYQLLEARKKCLALWLEGETPVKTTLRRLDRRQHRGPAPEHGTTAAARRHRTARESPCDLCAPILREQDRAKKARQKANQAVPV